MNLCECELRSCVTCCRSALGLPAATAHCRLARGHHQQAQIATTNRHKSPPPTGTNRHYRAPQTRLLIVMTWPRPTNHPPTNNTNMIQHSNQPHTHFRAVGTYSSISTIPQPSSSDTVVMTTRAPLHYQRQIKSNFTLHPRSCDPSLRPVVREQYLLALPDGRACLYRKGVEAASFHQ